MAERVNVKAKCLRYRGFFQWFILGLVIIVIVHFSVRDMYPSWLGFNVEKLEEKTVQRPSAGNAQKESVGQQPQQIQLQQQYQQQQYQQQQQQMRNYQNENKPEEPLKKSDEPMIQTGERQRAQEVDNTVQQKPEQSQQVNAQQSLSQAVRDQQQQQQTQQQIETKQGLFNQQQQQPQQEQQQAQQQQPQSQQQQPLQQQPQQQQPQQQQPQQQQPQQQIETNQGLSIQQPQQQPQQQQHPQLRTDTEGQKQWVQNVPAKYPFLDVTKSWEERVDDLVSRLTRNQVI